MNADLIAAVVAIGGLVTSFMAIAVSLFTARLSASKQALDSLESTITSISTDNNRLERRVEDLAEDVKQRDDSIRKMGIDFANSKREMLEMVNARSKRIDKIQDLESQVNKLEQALLDLEKVVNHTKDKS